MLVVGQTYGIGTHLSNHFEILALIITGHSPALALPVLVTADAAQAHRLTVEKGTLGWADCKIAQAQC